MQKNFTFKGIVRNADALYAKEGECLEVVNMHLKNGSMVPVPPPCTVAELNGNYSAIYLHSMASTYLCISADDGTVHLYDSDFRAIGSDGAAGLSDECVGVKRVEFMGNIVCMFTDNTTLYAIYDSQRYRWLGERPTMPTLKFSIESQVHKLTTTDKYKVGTPDSDDDLTLYWDAVAIGYFDRCIAKLNERGLFIDRVLFRYAMRLFDGSYAYYSPIYYIQDDGSVDGLSRDGGNFCSTPDNSGDSSTTFTVSVQGFKPSFAFESFDLSAWENIIVSIDLFCSGSIPGHKIADSDSTTSSSRNDGVYTSDDRNYERYIAKSNYEICRDVATHALFYKVAEYNLKGEQVDVLKDVSSTSLALSQQLPGDDLSLVSRTASYSYLFNGRLHLGNLRETFFKGYDAYSFAPAGMATENFPAMLFTEIKRTQGTVIVKKEYTALALGVANGNYYLTPYLMYPDARATAFTFVVTIGGVTYRKRFPLVRHRTMNIAYYIHDVNNGLTVTATANFADTGMSAIIKSSATLLLYFSYKPGSYTLEYSGEEWMYGTIPFSEMDRAFNIRGTAAVGDTVVVVIDEREASSYSREIGSIKIDYAWESGTVIDELQELNICEQRENVLKVSATDNPFSFPVSQTYTPSNNAIVAMCSNTVALSQGQFGQHPLYIFCADGIWAISSDTSGSVAYTGCYPMSREVCTSPSSVRSIDSGVLFMSAKGLMLISGNNISLLSEKLDAVNFATCNVNESNIFYRIARLAALEQSFESDTFKSYCAGASVGFIYSGREIIVTNSSYSYSYLLSLDSETWYKCTYTFDCIANSYPHFMALTRGETTTTVYTIDNDKSGCNDVMLISRPILWGTKQFKRVVQMMLHASIRFSNDTPSQMKNVACYLLGGNDGEHFRLLTGCERSAHFNDMRFPYMPTLSHRYYAVAIVGSMTTDSSITALEFAVSGAWNNRLS